MFRKLLIYLFSFTVIQFFLFLLIQRHVYAQNLTVSPISVGCGTSVWFRTSLLTQTERYRIFVYCDPYTSGNACHPWDGLILRGGSNQLGDITNANGTADLFTFDISGMCSNGGLVLNEGTYRAALQWNCVDPNTCNNAVVSPDVFTLVGVSGSCTLSPILPIYSGETGHVTISNANISTTYGLSLPGCTIDLTVYTTNVGRATFPISCQTAGNYMLTATSQATSNQRNCSINIPISQSAVTPVPSTSIIPNASPVPIATQFFAQCGDYCDDSNYPFGNCLTSRRDGCQRPTDEDGVGLDEDGSRDCSISNKSLDCWCCTQLYLPTPRVELNPLCPNDPNAISTAIGCLPIGDKNAFLTFILRWAIGISGGVSFILIIISGFMIMTASGDKRKLQSGRELLTAAIAGIILIIFSVFILDLVGIRILRIPGL